MAVSVPSTCTAPMPVRRHVANAPADTAAGLLLVSLVELLQGTGGCALASPSSMRQHVQDAVAFEQDARGAVAVRVLQALYVDLILRDQEQSCLVMSQTVQ